MYMSIERTRCILLKLGERVLAVSRRYPRMVVFENFEKWHQPRRDRRHKSFALENVMKIKKIIIQKKD